MIWTEDQIREQINERYGSKHFLAESLRTSTYKEHRGISDFVSQNAYMTEKRLIYESRIPFIILLTVSVLLLVSVPIIRSGIPATDAIKILNAVCLIMIGYCLYKIIFTQKIVAIIRENEIELKGQTPLKWEDILVTGQITSGESPDFLILGMADGRILKIPVEKSGMSASEFCQIIQMKKQQLSQNQKP